MCTVWMNQIDPAVSPAVFQTWNPLIEPAPEHVVSESYFERPVVTTRSADAMRQLAGIQGSGGVWFVGAYALYSVPLLENGRGSLLGHMSGHRQISCIVTQP